MTELKDRFSTADEIGTPDLWTEARHRAAASETPPRAVEWPPAWRRLGTGVVAFAVFAAAVVFAWDLAHPELGLRPPPAPAVDLASELPTGWSELPAPQEVRSGAVTAWTGSQLLIWGGYEYVGSGDEDSAADGFVFDGATRTWQAFADSPLSGRSDTASAWTGEEVLIWGGFDGGFREVPYFDDGAAFDPLTEKWRMLPAAPISARTPLSVWTGEELIVWGSSDRFARLRDGAAYDPATNSWRTIADGPIDITDGSASWTGREMIVFGAALDGNNHSDTPTAVGAAYDPDSDTWRELPPSELSPQAHTAQWVDHELIAWDYEHRTAAYDPNTNTWRALPKVPLSFAECGPESVATSQLVFGNYCGQTIVFSSLENAWYREPIPDLESEGCCRVLEPIPAGDVVLVPSHSYGMGLGEPDRRVFVYNPPRIVRTDPLGEVLEPEPFIPRGAERDGDLLRLPVVFPDGTEATLVYPIPLDLASLGIQPEVSYLWKDDPPPRFPIVFLHDPQASIAEFVDGTQPVGAVNSWVGIEIWRMSNDWSDRRLLPRGHWLRYDLESWTVLVAVERPEQAEEIARSLLIRETEAGFPVVETSGPIALSHESGEGEGPMLAVGSTLDPSVFLSIERCSGGSGVDEVLDSGAYGSACLANGRISATIYGNASTVEAIARGLRIDDVTSP